ncbi:MAG: RrF2 family transcriptional regulator [Candidatus Methylacidiphilales bacterium]
MKLSRKGIYGIRALIDLAIQSSVSGDADSSWLQISGIAERTQISEKFLEQILLVLKKNGVLKSRRGAVGGYALARPASHIRMDELLRILDAQLDPENEIETGAEGGGEALRRLVRRAEEASMEVLASKTLEDLARETRDWQDVRPGGIEFQI